MRMYVQTKKAGTREFLLVLAAAVAIYFIYELLRWFLPAAPLIKEVALIVLGGGLVYLVYQHYAASFEYRLGEECLSIERRIGHRVHTVSVPLSEIDSISVGEKPAGPKAENMCVRILQGEKTCYILYENRQKAVAFEPDGQLLEKLKEYK